MIVGIGHQMRVGKDTAAEALVRDLSFRRVGFADALKGMALDTDPLVTSSTMVVNLDSRHGHLAHTVRSMGWDRAKESVREVRTFLQNLGVAARKWLGDEVWVDALFRQVRGEEDIVIPDVRFVNEADAIKEAGGLLIKIVRPGNYPAGQHISETALADYDGWDLIIENTGTVHELQMQIVEFVKNKRRSSELPLQPVA